MRDRAKGGVGHRRLEVDARRHRRCVLVVCHGDGAADVGDGRGGRDGGVRLELHRDVVVMMKLLLLQGGRERAGKQLRMQLEGRRARASARCCEAGKRLARQLDALRGISSCVPLASTQRAVRRCAELREAVGLVAERVASRG